MNLEEHELLVRQVRWEAEGVVSLRLEDPDGGPLPAWQPGAHVDVVLPSGLVRQYSLCGRVDDRYAWTIAVLREPASRGGSEEVHSAALVGQRLVVRGPRNRFPLVHAESYLFIAGGVGVTPIVPMVRAVAARGAEWRLVYGGRAEASMAFLAELRDLGGDRVDVVPQDVRGVPLVAKEMEDAGAGTVVYCCGPEPMLRAVEDASAAAGLDCHLERFVAGADEASVAARIGVGDPFEVRLAKTGVTVAVPPGKSILSVLLDVLPELPYSCEDGFCGTCLAPVVDGEPDHRDDVLTPEEQARNDCMLICVGRSKSPVLTLDL